VSSFLNVNDAKIAGIRRRKEKSFRAQKGAATLATSNLHLSSQPHFFSPLVSTKMRLSLVSLLVAAATGVFAAEGSDVIDLNATNFESVVNPADLILVEFFAPW
jgi:hypothetical protein